MSTLEVVPAAQGFAIEMLHSVDMGETYERFTHPAVWATKARASSFINVLRRRMAAQMMKNGRSVDLRNWRVAEEAVLALGQKGNTYYVSRTRDEQPAFYSPLCQGSRDVVDAAWGICDAP
jgi:hypothetical protein